MARAFATSSDFITASAPTGFTAWAVSFWARPTNFVNNYAAIFSTSSSTGTSIRDTGKMAIYFSAFIDPGTITLNVGQWNHICVFGTNTTGMTLYVNGALDTAVGPISLNLDPTCQFGGHPSGWGLYVGSTADFALWNVKLTADEAIALSNGARPNTVRGKNLLRWWPFDGLQSPEPDLSGNAASGTVTGTAPASGPPVMQFSPRWPQFSEPPPLFYTIRKQVRLNILQTGP